MTVDEFTAVVSGFDRRPPQNLEAEMSVLGAIMLSKDAMGDASEVLRGGDFYKPAHETIFEAATDLYRSGEPVDAIAVSAMLQERGALGRIGGAEYLHTLIASVPSAASAGYYARLVRGQAILRRLVEAGTRIANRAYAADGDVDEIVDAAQADVYAVTERRNAEDYVAVAQAMVTALNEVDKAAKHDGTLLGVPTGFAQLDEITGGLQNGNMIVIAARPSVGKSTLGLDICRAAAIRGGKTAVIFSLEMTREEITKRLLSAEAGVKLTQLLRGPMGDGDWARLASTAARLSTAPLFIDDSPNMTLMEIRAKCRRLKQRENLGLVVVDYLQLMSSGKKVESRQQEVSEFSRALKLLAKELDVPVVAISQLNRSPEQRADKKPLLSDMRESGSIEQDADLVILLHREDLYDRDNRPGEADFIIAKHRNGPTDTISVAFKRDYTHFQDMPPDL